MDVRIVDVDLDNLADAPVEVLGAVYWEMEEEAAAGVDARFQKEEWFSSTLLEWGTCGKLARNGRGIGFAEYAPAPLFPRLRGFRCGRVSADAAYLSYCYLVPEFRGRRIGEDLVRAVARDLIDRGYRALEAIGDREWEGGWVLPATFLEAVGFTEIREDSRFPLMRLDLSRQAASATRAEAVSTRGTTR